MCKSGMSTRIFSSKPMTFVRANPIMNPKSRFFLFVGFQSITRPTTGAKRKPVNWIIPNQLVYLFTISLKSKQGEKT